MDNLYKGICPYEDEAELIKMLDEVFFADDPPETRTNFMELLPKLYKKQYNPAASNVVVKENGVLKAAVGGYASEVSAAGRRLRVYGIGNVAVSKDSRRKGYMIDCMNMALDIMKKEDFDYSLLDGQRQRYGFFGFEPAGCACNFRINAGNIRRILGADAKSPFTAREITESDGEIIKKIKALNESLPFYPVRSEKSYLDIIRNWSGIPYAVFEGELFKGYFVAHKSGSLLEIKATDTSDMLGIVMCAMDVIGKDSVSFTLPQFDTQACEYMAKICDGMSLCNVEKLNILNYGRFIDAFLAVKAQRMKLCPGSVKLLIHGCKRDENLLVSVSGSEVSVTEIDGEPDVELSHGDAIRFLTGLVSEQRFSLPSFAQNWFPLDFYSYSLDNV